MRRFVLSLSVMITLSVPAAASAEAAPAPATKPDPDRIVCVRERPVGSHRPKRVCMTLARRDELRLAAERALDPTRAFVPAIPQPAPTGR